MAVPIENVFACSRCFSLNESGIKPRFYRACLIVAIGSLGSMMSMGAVFSVEGTCRFTTHFKASGPETTSYPFTMSVSNCNWLMRITDIQSNAPAGFCEISYDGKYTYFLLFEDEWAKIAKTHQGTGQQENVAVGIITPHQVPHFDFAPESGVIWLAYGSGCYLAAANSAAVEPAASLGVGPHGVNQASFLEQKAFWSAEKPEPRTPDEVTYLDNGVISSNGAQITRWPTPLDQGFTNTTYQVLDRTNLGVLTVPARAIMKTFYPTFDGESGHNMTAHLILFYDYEVEVTNITTALLHTGGFKPEIPGVTLIDDWRFTTSRKSLGFNYFDREGRWLDDAEAKKLPQFTVAEASVPPAPSLKSSRWPFVVVLGVLAIVPIGALFRRTGLPKNENKT